MGLQILFFSMYGRFILLDLKVGFESLHGWGLSLGFNFLSRFCLSGFSSSLVLYGSLAKLFSPNKILFRMYSVLNLSLVQFSC